MYYILNFCRRAQLVAHELGIGVDEVEVVQGDTDRTAVRPRHLRVAVDAGVRGGHGRRGAEGAGAGTAGRGGDAGGGAAGPGVGGGPLPGARRAGDGRVVPGDRHGRALQPRAARRRRGPPGRDGRLQPAQPDVPVRGLHLRRRGRPRHGAGRRAPVRRGGRLRRADQPDDRRGPDPRRPRRRVGMALMELIAFDRDGQPPGRLVHGLPAADGAGVPDVGAGGDRHALAAPPGGRQGRGGVGDGRLARRRRQRRAGRDRGAARGHAAHPGAGVAGRAGAPDASGSRDRRRAMRTDLLARVDGLRTRRTPFVLATVVRAERPTSAKPGDCAVVTADGTLDGFVGGVVRGVDRARGEPAAARGGGVRAAADHPGRRRRGARAGRRADGRQPVPLRRHAGDLPGGDDPADAGGGVRGVAGGAGARAGGGRAGLGRADGARAADGRHVRRGRRVARARRARRAARGAGRPTWTTSRWSRAAVARPRCSTSSARPTPSAPASTRPPGWTSARARRRRSRCRSARGSSRPARASRARRRRARRAPVRRWRRSTRCAGWRWRWSPASLQVGDVYFCGPGCLAAWRAAAVVVPTGTTAG